MSTAPGHVILHVGLPKTGTSFLQGCLARYRGLLAQHGVDAHVGSETFIAALDLRGTYENWGRSPNEVAGQWASLCAEVKRQAAAGNNVLISQELLASATHEQVRRAREMLTTDRPPELVLTVRDPARQLVADWQEWVKHGEVLTFEDYLDLSLRNPSKRLGASSFQETQDLADVLDRWSGVTEPQRVHVVTVPPRGAARGELWERFADVVGIDTEIVPWIASSTNASLGAPEIALLSRVNRALRGRLRRTDYQTTVKWFYSQDLLAPLDSPRAVLPASLHAEVTALAQGWVAAVRAAGYRVHGSLEDILPGPAAPAESPAPDEVSTEEVLRSSVAATASLLVEVHRARTRIKQLREENRRLREQ